jgi:hypothetical protein
MVFVLVLNVVGHTIQMGMGNRKCAVALLPREPTSDPALLVNVIGRSRFDVPDQIRRSDVRFKPKQHMRVIRHTVNGDEFLTLPRDDASDVLLQLLTVCSGNHACPSRNSENNMQIYLRVGIRHFTQRSHAAPSGAYMIRARNYKYVAPTALAPPSEFALK